MNDTATGFQTAPRILDELPLRLHHNAYVCANQEKTRHFYEDIVGLPLVAAWIEQTESPDFPGRKIPFMHSFFGIGDGGALAFFEFADADVAAKFKARQQPFYVHIALAVSEKTQDEIKRRLEAENIPVRERDHGYCKSIYAADPDGLMVEFTSDPANVAEIDAWQRATAHETLKRWSAGDRTVNNTIRPHR
jgi:catechol 2,3-dioxygenase-like lactoylglutathione lyase family enzyme